jgi:hypothetical protein
MVELPSAGSNRRSRNGTGGRRRYRVGKKAGHLWNTRDSVNRVLLGNYEAAHGEQKANSLEILHFKNSIPSLSLSRLPPRRFNFTETPGQGKSLRISPVASPAEPSGTLRRSGS